MIRKQLIVIATACALTANAAHAAAAATKPKPSAHAHAKAESARLVAVHALTAAKANAQSFQSCQAFRDHPEKWVPATRTEAIIGTYVKKGLADQNFEKGKYETSQEYAKRVGDTIDAYVGDHEKATFIESVDESAQSYDADTSTLKISFPGAIHSLSALPVPVAHSEREEKFASRIGETVMGVKFRYEVWAKYTQVISLSPQDSLGKQDVYRDVTLTIPRDDAKRLKFFLKLVVLGSFEAPYPQQSDDHPRTPSLDDPVSESSRTETWSIRPRCMYLYDSAERKILHTYFEEDGAFASH